MSWFTSSARTFFNTAKAPVQRRFSSAAAAAEKEQYAKPLQYLHWIMAGGFTSCVGLVLAAQNTPKENSARKGQLMTLHKSFGVLMAACVPARLALRLATKIPGHLAGNPKVIDMAGSAGHAAMYAALVILPGTGVAMGYFNGRGLPFFGLTTIPGAEKPNGEVAKRAFKIHSLTGQAFEYLLPIHVGAVGFHHLKGQNALRRMNPFAK